MISFASAGQLVHNTIDGSHPVEQDDSYEANLSAPSNSHREFEVTDRFSINSGIESSSVFRESLGYKQSKDPKKSRLVSKSGELNVFSKNVPNRTKLYLSDMFTTLVDMRWHWVIMIFVGNYIASWMLFAAIWWLIVRLRGTSVCVIQVGHGGENFILFI